MPTGLIIASGPCPPHPDIRQLFIDAWLLARQQTDRGTDFFIVNQQIQQGMEQAQERINAYRAHFLLGLQYITVSGRANALTEFEAIRHDLEDYVRPALLHFSVS